MKQLLNKYSTFVFAILLLLVAIIYGYPQILHFRPYSTHQWRQTDCLSIILNYSKGGMHFFQPEINFLGTSDGKGIAEFPILYYIEAFLWKTFGTSELLVRCINIAIVFIGLICLFKTVRIILNDSFFAILLTLLIFTSPILSFYTNNFMLNAPALGLVFVGWYFFARFYLTQKNKFLVLASFIFILAALFRLTMVIGFGFVYLVFFLERISSLKFGKEDLKLFKKPLLQFFLLFIPILFLAAWYSYAKYYNDIHQSSYFLTEIKPIWKAVAIFKIAILFFNNLLPELLSWFLLYASLTLFVVILVRYKKQQSLLLIATVSSFIGVVLYLLLWYENFTVHDYYLIDLLPFIILIFITFFYYLRNYFHDVFQSTLLKICCAIALLTNIYYCALRTRIQYNSKDFFVRKTFIFSQPELDYWNWYHWNYNNTTKAFETVKPYLRSLGITRTDTVISMPDQSPNITLYFMDEKGFTDLYFNDLKGKNRINFFIKKGAKYLIIGDTNLLSNDYLKPFTTHKMGSYKNISIYDLRNLPNLK